MERGPAAKAVTEPEARRADRRLGNPRQSPMAVGLAVRLLAPVRSTERAGGRGDTSDLTGMSWLGSSGRATVFGPGAVRAATRPRSAPPSPCAAGDLS
jgi:hypothetical protein